MMPLLKLLLNPLFNRAAGHGLVIAGVVAFLVGGFALDHMRQRRKLNNAIGEINRSVDELAAEALEARAGADRPGAAGRLLQHSCRDC
ncbi:MAG: hypothetical protein ACRCS9_08725 [Hyphomicrobium sp.]